MYTRSREGKLRKSLGKNIQAPIQTQYDARIGEVVMKTKKTNFQFFSFISELSFFNMNIFQVLLIC